MVETKQPEFTFKHVFTSDSVLQAYGQSSLLLFVLLHYLGADDVRALAAEALTDWADDKKADCCYIDVEEGRAVIAQAYLSKRWGKLSARANKASDLTTATSWLLAQNLSDVPELLRPKAKELQDGIRAGDIERIELLYVHNCHESKNVCDELRAAANSTKSHVQAISDKPVGVTYKEFGLESIESLYRSQDLDILVDGVLSLPGQVLNHVEEDSWKAVVISVPGSWIRKQYLEHGEALVSANLRGYLGARKGSINEAIKLTASAESRNFWVYNNGITCITNQLDLSESGYTVRGLSIINGAQTAGALAECDEDAAAHVRVLCRVVESKDKGLIEKIIVNNNTQNIIRPSDLVSNDRVQKDLAHAFQNYGISYVHRRSSTRSPRNSISASAIGAALCAFHGEPQIAGRNSRDIFLSRPTYDRVFPPHISPEHVFLVTSLASAVDLVKYQTKEKVDKKIATQLDEQQYEVLRYSMSKHFMMYLAGAVAEQLLNTRIPNLHELKAKPAFVSGTNTQLESIWAGVLRTLLPHVARSAACCGSVYDVTRSTEKSKKVADDLQAVLASLEPSICGQLQPLREAVAS